MIDDKRVVLDEHGLDTLLLKIFRVVEDTYMRRSEYPENPLENISFEVRTDGCLYLIYDEAKTEDMHIYGFELNMNESSPSGMISYIGDNEFYTSARMNYDTGRFTYGSWANAFFIKNLKVVMLKYDGTVDYELNKNDYTKKIDGQNSDIDKLEYPGNVMVGIPTVWIKVDTSDTAHPRFYFASHHVDSTYHAYAHTNADGDVVPYIYLAAYDGYEDEDRSNVMRSISGYTPTGGHTGNWQPTQCRINNIRINNVDDNIWDMQCLADRELITLLLLLIGKSTDSQAVFGNGNCYGASNPATNAGADATNGILPTGTMNTKGLFWGSSETNLGVKVFGIENFWGNIWKRISGLILDTGTIKYKLTRGTQDGSGASDYTAYFIKNEDGSYSYSTDGFLSAGPANAITAGQGQFISDMYVGDFGLLPKKAEGSSSTYYCDMTWVNFFLPNGQPLTNGLALMGGGPGNGFANGPLSFNMATSSESFQRTYGASIVCKPHE